MAAIFGWGNGRNEIKAQDYESAATDEPRPLPDHGIELRAEWDDERAAYKYVLYRVGTFSMFSKPAAGDWYWVEQASSKDEEWAKRQAEHYGVEIIKEEQ